MRWYVLLLAMLFVPAAQATPLVSFEDPEGDVRMNYPPAGVPFPLNVGVDLVEASMYMVDDTFEVHLRVSDLSAVSNTDAGVFPDTMFIFRWDVESTSRNGGWMTRADYQPSNSVAWSFWAEGPCLDGNDAGGCAGGDRDIRDGLRGRLDMETDTIVIEMPVHFIPDLINATFSGFVAATDAVWPMYPVYIGDRAQDLNGTIVNFTEQGPQSSQPSAPMLPPQEASANNTDTETSSATQRTPWPFGLVTVLLAVTARRRRAIRAGASGSGTQSSASSASRTNRPRLDTSTSSAKAHAEHHGGGPSASSLRSPACCSFPP